MKKLLFGLLLVLGAIGLGYLIRQDPGYILVYYRHWSITTSLWVGLVALILTWLIIHYLLRVIKHILSLRAILGSWSHQRRHKKALSHVDQGLSQLLNADWKKSENTFNKSDKDSPNPLVNYYFSAMAAHQQGNLDTRDQYLTCAYNLSEQFETPILLYKAQLQIDSTQWDEAQITLEHLYQKAPKNKLVLNLLKKVMYHLENWQRLEQLLPELDKHQCIDKTELHALYEDLYVAYLKLVNLSDNPEILETRWNNIPQHYKSNASVLYQYVTSLIITADYNKAIPLIETFLRKQWEPKLAALYGTIPGGEIPQRILVAEKWLQKHPNDVDLLFSLAQLTAREKLWTKSHDYLQTCQKLSPNSKYLIELASLCELTGKHSDALQYYKDSLKKQ